MGLALEVGILADLKENDAEGYERVKIELESLNPFLESCGLRPRHEPENCEVWSSSMLGYSGLHELRRLAAHLDAGLPLPPSASTISEVSKDPLLEGYYALPDGPEPGIFRRLFSATPRYQRKFDHLLLHSDADGYYLPIDFPEVLVPPGHLEIPGDLVGSAHRLLAELDRLALALQIPAHLMAESKELWDAIDAPASDERLWRRYGRESFGCVALREGCRKSIELGAALVFT